MKQRAILYLRVSTEEQTKGLSLSQQESELKKYCLRMDYEVVKIISEGGQSAKTFNRRSWKEFENSLTKKINHDSADVFLVTQIDRFSRNGGETRRMTDFLKSKKIKLYSLLEGRFDFSDPELYMPNVIHAATAEYDNILKARRVKAAMRHGLEEGRWMWRAPIGYKNNKETKTIFLDDDKAPLIRYAFEAMAKGTYTAEEVRMQLSQKGLKIQKSSFFHILRNPIYTGKIVRQAYEEGERIIQEKVVQGLHQPIISEITFNMVQNVLNGSSKKYKGKTKHEEMFLRGFLYCPICDKRMTGGASTGNGGTYHYYNCQRKNGCNNSIKAERANNAFIEYIATIQPRKEILALYKAMLEKHFDQSFDSIEIQKRKLENRIKDIQSKKDKFLDRFINSEGVISDKDYRDIMDRIEEEKSEFVMQHATLKSIPSEYKKYLEFGISLLGNLKGYFQAVDIDTKQRIIGSIFPEKLIFEDNKYRTTKMNEFFALYCSASKGLNKKLLSSKAKQSNMAPPVGLEPTTP